MLQFGWKACSSPEFVLCYSLAKFNKMLFKISWLFGICGFLNVFIQADALKDANFTYMASIPKYIRPGFDITYNIWVKSDDTVQVITILHSSDGAIEMETMDSVTANDALINVGKVPLGYSGSTKFTMNITGVNATTGEEIFYNSTTMFSYASKSVSVLIQTDKAIYQPGETVRFRAVCLNPDLRPLTGIVTYQIQDPNQNIVLLNKTAMLSHGVAGGELELSKDAVNGDWKITYIVEGYKEELIVTVQFYKLPKYEVTLDTPTYIHPGSEGFTIRLNAVYTYGKPVDGTAVLDIEMQSRYGRFGGLIFPNIITKQFANYDGSLSVFITKDEITNKLGWDEQSERKILVTGYVTEHLTGNTFNDTAEIMVKRTHIKLETLYKPDTIKPGLIYTAYIRVSEQDGKPLMEKDRLNNSLIVKVIYRYPYAYPTSRGQPIDGVIVDSYPVTSPPPVTETYLFSIPEDGVVIFSLKTKHDGFSSVTFEPYTNATGIFSRYKNRWEANRAESPSDSYLQIATNDSSVAAGDSVEVIVRTTEAVSELKIMLISRGKILSEALYATPSGQPEIVHSWVLQITKEMVPSVQILVTYIRSDGELVTDYLTLGVSLSLENQVSITSSAMAVDAGDDVSIKVQTSGENSYVGARAIDQSVLLLKSGNDITRDRIVQDLNGYSVSDKQYSDNSIFRWWFYPRPSGAKDAKSVFENAGVIVLTDATVFQSEPEFFPLPIFFARGVVDFSIESDRNRRLPDDDSSGASSTSQSSLRSFFPETWIWDESITGPDGSATFNTTAPDTITSWVLSAFSVSDEYGLGVAETSKITVFRNFFVSLNLPLKITRGEIIVVQAIVFNYFDSDLDVNLTLTLDEGLELLLPGDDPIAAGPQRMLKVKSNGAVSVKFPVQSNGLGELRITASAVSQMAADALERIVFVRPEGIRQCYSASTLINRESDKENDFREKLEIRLPEGMVEGSGVVKLYVYGDILGSSMNNLGRLLVAPSGCGEQNMLGFAPDVFVTIYLDKVEMLDSETRKKAYEHFQDGYMTELKYKHKDGSYSAFGERDDSGSTWLTAFVTKCFLFARKLRPELVETRIVDEAINFLVEQQNTDGSFNEPGRVIHTDMQGGVDSPITITAYVLIALRETLHKNDKKYMDDTVEEAVVLARTYLESNLNRIKTNKYALALVTYALHVSGSANASDALAALEALATNEDGVTYWHEATAGASSYSLQWRPPYSQTPSNDIEMTAYALLTYVKNGNLASAVPVMKWLTSKQNELGGYSSTQDTVIAIQALSSVACLLTGRDQDLTIMATHSLDPTFSERFDIDQSNSIVFNSAEVPPVNGDLTIEAIGVGIGVAQLSVCYNIPNDPYEDEPFNCTVDVSSKDVNSAMVNFCCKLNDNEDEATGMFVFEVGLLNGFTADQINEEIRNPKAQMIEIDDDSVNVYYDQLTAGENLCANVELLRYAEVGASKPATLMAFDYYKPDKKIQRLYSIEGVNSTGPCQVCGLHCVGCPTPYLGDWRPWSPCVEFCKPENSTRSRLCVDPSLNKPVDVGQCGLDEIPTEIQMCKNPGFPCPDFVDGFWYDLPSGFGSFSNECIRFGRQTSPQSGSPGTTLNGASTHIRCGTDGELHFDPQTGFSVSLLVNPRSYEPRRTHTFLAYGANGAKPFYRLEKLWWKDEIRFRINYNSVNNTILNINSSDIPTQQWSLIIITFNNEDGANVYINGKLVGEAVSLSRPNITLSPHWELYLGKSSYRTPYRALQGYLAGSFSGLNYWLKKLKSNEVEALASFYRQIIEYDGPEPLLTPRHLRSFAPPPIQHCFAKPAYLSELYAGTADANQKCGNDSPFVIILE